MLKQQVLKRASYAVKGEAVTAVEVVEVGEETRLGVSRT
jgi:hypothetical protein